MNKKLSEYQSHWQTRGIYRWPLCILSACGMVLRSWNGSPSKSALKSQKSESQCLQYSYNQKSHCGRSLLTSVLCEAMHEEMHSPFTWHLKKVNGQGTHLYTMMAAQIVFHEAVTVWQREDNGCAALSVMGLPRLYLRCPGVTIFFHLLNICFVPGPVLRAPKVTETQPGGEAVYQNEWRHYVVRGTHGSFWRQFFGFRSPATFISPLENCIAMLGKQAVIPSSRQLLILSLSSEQTVEAQAVLCSG